jgi:hypothetical protein
MTIPPTQTESGPNLCLSGISLMKTITLTEQSLLLSCAPYLTELLLKL